MLSARTIRVSLRVLTALLAACLLLIAAGLATAWAVNPPARVTNAHADPEGPHHIGTPIECEVSVELPWYRWPDGLKIQQVPEGLQVIGQRGPRLRGIGLGTWTWRLSALVQAYDLGELEEVQLRVDTIGRQTGEDETLEAVIGPFNIEPRLADKQGRPAINTAPAIANALRNRSHAWYYWAGLAGLLVLVGLVLLSLLLGKDRGLGEAPVPAWERTEMRLAQLEDELPLSAEVFFVRLTDIVRRYVEERFGLRAAEQATPEFLREAEKDPRIDKSRRDMLAEFLNAADMVKFARRDATPDQMSSALYTARDFIWETKPENVPHQSSRRERGTQAANRAGGGQA